MLGFAQCAKSGMEPVEAGLEQLSPDRKDQMKGIMALAAARGEERASLRTETTYTISEALDLLDETLNYAYCRPSTPLQNTIILSDTLMMEVITSTLVSEEEIANLFDETSLDLGTQYHALGLSNMEAWAFSVAEYGSLVGDELPVIIQLEVAYGEYITESITYGEYNNYSYQSGGGFCDESLAEGAPEILRDNLKYSHVYNPPSTKKYYKRPRLVRVCNQVSTVTICGGAGIPQNIFVYYDMLLNGSVVAQQNWDNINDWKLFRQHEGVQANFDKCLSGDVEMPFVEDNMGGIITDLIPNGTYYPGNLWVGSNEVTTGQNQHEIPFHNMVIAYYQSVVVESNDDKIALPCNDC